RDRKPVDPAEGTLGGTARRALQRRRLPPLSFDVRGIRMASRRSDGVRASRGLQQRGSATRSRRIRRDRFQARGCRGSRARNRPDRDGPGLQGGYDLARRRPGGTILVGSVRERRAFRLRGRLQMSKPRLGYLVTHPIQYQAPLLRKLAASGEVDLSVFFLS